MAREIRGLQKFDIVEGHEMAGLRHAAERDRPALRRALTFIPGDLPSTVRVRVGRRVPSSRCSPTRPPEQGQPSRSAVGGHAATGSE